MQLNCVTRLIGFASSFVSIYDFERGIHNAYIQLRIELRYHQNIATNVLTRLMIRLANKFCKTQHSPNCNTKNDNA